MENLTRWVKEEKITIYHSVPQLFRSFTKRLEENEIVESIRLVLLGGEAIYKTDMELFKKHCSKNSLLANLLGSSEVLVGTIFFLKQYLKGLPNDIIEAAKIDGAGHGNIFCYIIIPLSVPSLIAFGLINFLGKYNDYLGALLYLQSPERYTLQIVLAFLQDDRSNWSAVLAGSVLSLAPMLAVYVIFQKYMLKGISMASGLKA